MLSFIKTALVTIIISFISGVLLDYYRNYAPRILCSMGRNKSIRKNSKKVKVYSLIIKNISKKTIHNLNVNIAAKCNTLKLHNTKITNGLRFDIDDENNMFNITIPFLSPNDGLMTKIILEGDEESNERPIINLKSPENFKQIDSYKSKPQENDHIIIDHINNFFEKVFYNNRKIILGIVTLAILVFMGILAGEYYSNTINNGNKLYQKAGSGSTTPSSNGSKDASSINESSYTEDSAVDSENYGSEVQKQTGEEEPTSNYPTTTYNQENGYNNSTNTTEQGNLNPYDSQGEGTTTDTTTNNEGTTSTGDNTDSSNDTTSTTDTLENNNTTEDATSDGGTTEDQGGENGDTTSSGGTTGDVGNTSTPNEISETYNLFIN